MLLVVLDGSGRRSDYFYLHINNRPEVYELGVRFLVLHRPHPAMPAKPVAAARTLARDTHRRVWIVDQDARDSSSVRLSHWLDDQRPLLDRDFVIVKLLGGRDQHISDVCKDSDLGESPTWFAIIDGAGTMLANSEQAENSFNYPRSADEKRQFRGVLQKTVRTLTPTDVDRLMTSSVTDWSNVVPLGSIPLKVRHPGAAARATAFLRGLQLQLRLDGSWRRVTAWSGWGAE